MPESNASLAAKLASINQEALMQPNTEEQQIVRWKSQYSSSTILQLPPQLFGILGSKFFIASGPDPRGAIRWSQIVLV